MTSNQDSPGRLPFVRAQQNLREALAVVDDCAKGICLVVDDDRRLLATVTDGDFRRAILAGLSLDTALEQLLQIREKFFASAPVTAAEGTSDAELIHMMSSRSLRHIPIVTSDDRVCGLAVLNDLVRQYELPVTGVIMAGGFGKRLQPLTHSTPKSMLPVNGRPLMEHIVCRLREAGIRDLNVTTHYRGGQIKDHFKDGSEFGVNISYVEEDRPLGTAGALARLRRADSPLLVINGDILTTVDFRAMFDFHREHQAKMTVAVRQYEIQVPYGVVDTDGVVVRRVVEKPTVRHFINAGIYLLDPGVCSHIPPDDSFDMPQLIAAVIASGGTVISFPIREYWLDIGHMEQYQRATADASSGVV